MGTQKYELTTLSSGVGRVHLVTTFAANWVILEQGGDLTLIDGGYPRQAQLVLQSIADIGSSPDAIRGALLTHAHVDHLGGLAALQRTYGFPIYMAGAEVPHAAGDVHQQSSPAQVMRLVAGQPRAAVWATRIVGLGGLAHPAVQGHPFPITTGPLDLPGAPEPLVCPGHTSGHSAYLVGEGAAVATGDAVVSAHPTLGTAVKPQLLPALFHHDAAEAARAVHLFEGLGTRVMLPGHGPGRTVDFDQVAATLGAA